MRIFTASVIYLIFFCITVQGLNPQKSIKQYLHKNWQYEEGLPHNTITSIAQTRDGYLWLGSKQGVIRFDGVKFTEFTAEKYPAFQNDDIWVLFGDSKNNLWIGTDGGGLLKYSNGKFQKFTTEQGLADNVVWSINEDREGNLWIGTGGGGLSRYSNGKFTNITQLDGLSSNYIWSVFQDRSGNIWAGTDGNGLNRINERSVTVFSTANGFPSNYVFSITEDNSGNLFFGTIDGLIEKKGKDFLQYTTQNGLAHNAVWSLLKDRDNNIWIGTDGGGISKYYNGKIESFSMKDGLYSNLISSVFEDSEGNIWVSTKGGGINRLKEGFINTLSADGNELPNDYALCVYEDRKKNIWIGTYGGLSLKTGNSFKKFTIKDGLSSPLILSITDDKEGNLWVGTDGGGINLYKNGKFFQYGTSDGLTSNSIWALQVDKNNTLWIGTDGGGLNSFRGGKFNSYNAEQGIPSEFISTIHIDRSGKLWVGTHDAGLFFFQNGKFHSISVKDGLLSDIVWAIYEDENNNIWIATNGGLNRFINGKLSSYTLKDGLFNNNIYSVIEDSDKNLWMSSNRGLFKVAKKTFDDYDKGLAKKISYINFGIDDGMKAAECSNGNPSSIKSGDGKLWFPTIKGVAFLDTQEIRESNITPHTHIEKLLIDFREFDPGQKIESLPGDGRIEIGFTALNYSAPERILFKYKLNGYDEDWIDAGYLRNTIYTNLPPGEYSFNAVASLDGSSWNYNSPAHVDFKIQPHFWQTWWFRILLTFLIIILLASYYLYRMYSIKKQNRILSILVSERTFELESEVAARKEKELALKASEENLKQINISKDKLFSIISHDLRSPFQGILGFASLLKDEIENLGKDEIEKMAINIHKLAQMYLQLLNNLLEWSRLQRGAVEYKPQALDLTEMINRIVVLFYENANSKNISLRTELTHNLEIYADENMLASVIQNLISNAIKFTNTNGSVIISTADRDNFTLITVSDNGVGMEKELVDKLFAIGEKVSRNGTANEKGSGLGLMICKELIENNNGKISAKSAPGKGSTFTIEFPPSSKNVGIPADKNKLKVYDIKKAKNN